MKRVFLIVVWTAVLLSLTSCKGRHENIMKEAVSYAERNEAMLCACAQEVYELISDLEDLSFSKLTLAYKIQQIDGTTMRLSNHVSETETTFQSNLCRELFDAGFVEYIMIHFYAGKYNTEFSCDGYGLGSNTHYYAIEFIASGDARDLWWYSSDVTYTEKNGGYYGEAPDGDNAFFYYPITEQLYYCEAHF